MEKSIAESQEKNKIVIIEEEKQALLIAEEIESLCDLIPSSMGFIREQSFFEDRLKKKKDKPEKISSITELRAEVIRSAERRGIDGTRKKIKKLLKKYPRNPDLRVLNGIQLFNDVSLSGLNEGKLDALRNALEETALALYNDGISIFCASWFTKIYLKYLEILRERQQKIYNSTSNNYNWQVQRASEKLQKGMREVNSLITLKDKLNGLMMLNAKMKNTVYATSRITLSEIRAASAAMNHDVTKTVGTGKTANYVMYVTITLSLLFARVPILEKLLKEILSSISETSRDVQLQKNMIMTMIGVTSFQMAIGNGDATKAKELAKVIYKRCVTVAANHLEYSTLTKPHEVDPLLKAVWIVTESSELFEEGEYKIMIRMANRMLKRVLYESGEVKGSVDLARQLQASVQDLLRRFNISEY